MSNVTSDAGQEDFWIDGSSHQSYNTGLPVKEEQFWINGESVEFLQSDPVSVDFLSFIFL